MQENKSGCFFSEHSVFRHKTLPQKTLMDSIKFYDWFPKIGVAVLFRYIIAFCFCFQNLSFLVQLRYRLQQAQVY